MYELHYTGIGYPSFDEITTNAKKRGFTHGYWASDESWGFTGMYNGDTVVVYDNIDSLPDNYREDAIKYGKPIK